jgi:hypothetical protein
MTNPGADIAELAGRLFGRAEYLKVFGGQQQK